MKFSYDPNSPYLLTGVQDGQLVKDNRTEGVVVTYLSGTPYRVSSVTMPPATSGGSAHPTSFTYGPVLNGDVVTQTVLIDPRGTTTSSIPDDYKVWTDLNTAGLPIRIFGPYDANNPSLAPATRMVWDGYGNLRCSRSPAANAVAEAGKCEMTGDPFSFDFSTLNNALNTYYEYTTEAPYRLLMTTGPAPDPAGAGARPVTQYSYDDQITGLLELAYENKNLAGMAGSKTVDDTIAHDWGTGNGPGLSVANNFSVRWTGFLYTAPTHTYKFRLWSDDGVSLVIGNSQLMDCFGSTAQAYDYNCHLGGSGTPAEVKKYLKAGKKTPITIEYQEKTGSAHIDLRWDRGLNGSFYTVAGNDVLPQLGLLTSEITPLAATKAYTYKSGQVDYRARALPTSTTLSAAGQTSRTTSYTYDGYGRTLTEQDSTGTTTTAYWSDTSQKDCAQTLTDSTGAVTDYDCNLAGDDTSTTVHVRAKDAQPAQDRTTTKTYDGVGRVKTVTTSDGSVTRVVTNTYDDAGRLTQVADAAGGQTRTTAYDYYLNGLLWHETLPDPDGAGPLTSPVTVHEYDEMGNETRTTDARGKVWTKTFDAKNRVLTAKDPYLNTSTTSYDDMGLATGGMPGVATVTATPPSGAATVTGFDIPGNKASEKLGTLYPRTFEYDVAGNLTKATEPRNPSDPNQPDVWTSFAYNAFGEKTSSTTPRSPNNAVTSFAYDTAGRLSTITDANTKVTTYGYDGEGRVTSVTPPGLAQGETPWALHYDDAGERVRVIDPNNRVRDFTSDLLGRPITSVETRDQSHVYTTSFHYNGFSELTSVDDPRNTTLYFEYD